MAPEAQQPSPAPLGQSPVPKRKLWKFIVAFLAIILFAFIVFVGLAIFNQWRGEKRVEEVAEYLKNLNEKLYQEQLADTIGGKTPQETLRFYIEAVERGDYGLASKYFIHENQKEDLETLKGVSTEDIKSSVERLKKSLAEIQNTQKDLYTSDRKYFSTYKPYLVRMVLYPSGVWKIIEI